jgi:hypothetical protein
MSSVTQKVGGCYYFYSSIDPLYHDCESSYSELMLANQSLCISHFIVGLCAILAGGLVVSMCLIKNRCFHEND